MPKLVLPAALLFVLSACVATEPTPSEVEDARLQKTTDSAASDAMQGMDAAQFDVLTQ